MSNLSWCQTLKKRNRQNVSHERPSGEYFLFLCVKEQTVKDPAQPSRWQDFQNGTLTYPWAFIFFRASTTLTSLLEGQIGSLLITLSVTCINRAVS